MFRKLKLRRLLLSDKSGLVYVPFIGDGDIALELFQGLSVYGAYLDPNRVATARGRLQNAIIKVADCDRWPFAGEDFPGPFVIGDFDAYNYPYHSFRAWFENAPLADKLTVFFTDAQCNHIGQRKNYIKPNGQSSGQITLSETRKVLNFYPRRILEPWLREYALTKGYQVAKVQFYRRATMFYWGAVLTR